MNHPLDIMCHPLDMMRHPFDIMRHPLDIMYISLSIMRHTFDIMRHPLDIENKQTKYTSSPIWIRLHSVYIKINRVASKERNKIMEGS